METVHTYTMNCWDCPTCGYVNTDDAEFNNYENCQDCGEPWEISS